MPIQHNGSAEGFGPSSRGSIPCVGTMSNIEDFNQDDYDRGFNDADQALADLIENFNDIGESESYVAGAMAVLGLQSKGRDRTLKMFTVWVRLPPGSQGNNMKLHEGDSVFVKIPGTISDTDWGITVVIDKRWLTPIMQEGKIAGYEAVVAESMISPGPSGTGDIVSMDGVLIVWGNSSKELPGKEYKLICKRSDRRDT